MNVCECRIKVRYDEIGLYSMVHHSNYAKWFDVALCELLRENGVTIGWFEKKGIYFPVYESNCKFNLPVHIDDELTIRTNILTLSPVAVTFGYKFYRDDILVASGSTSHIFSNANMRPISIRKALPELYEAFAQYIQE